MIINLSHHGLHYTADLAQPLDISIAVQPGADNPNCYWADDVTVETIVAGDFIGSVKQGGSVNYQKLTITPHGNGTHTECYGHISRDDATIYDCLKQFMFVAELVTVSPQQSGDDFVITRDTTVPLIKHQAEALIIRTAPNDASKKNRRYSNTNPPYMEPALAAHLAAQGYHHLLIDLPSVDREVDGGALLAHRAFWQYPQHTRTACTITELIYVDDSVKDGLYLLNLQIMSLKMDASPGKPILYKLTEVA